MIFDKSINYLSELSGISIEITQTLFLGLSIALAVAGIVLVLRLFRKTKKRRYR